MSRKTAEEIEEAEQAEQLVTLAHEFARGDYTLTIADRRYDVAGGVVRVAPVDYEAALQAGFRPA